MAAILRSSRILRSLLTKRLAAISSRTNAIGTNPTNPTNPTSSNDVLAQQIRRYTPIQSDIYDVRGAVAQPALGLKIGHSPPSKLGLAKLGTDALPPRNPSESGTNNHINEGTQVGSACTNTIVVVANNSEATSQTQPIPKNLTPIVNVQNPASSMETSSQSALEATTIKQSFLPTCQNKIVTKSLILAVDIQHQISCMETYSESMLEATAKMQNSLPPKSMAAGADKSGSLPPEKPPDVDISSVNTTNIRSHEKGNKCRKFVPKPPASKSICEDTLIVPTEPCRLAQSKVTWASKVSPDTCKTPTSTGSKSTSSSEKKPESKKSACASKKETPNKSICASKKETPPSSEKKTSSCFDNKPACLSTKSPPLCCEISLQSKKSTSATKKETPSSSEKKTGCTPKKKTPPSSEKKSACASKKETPPSSEKKAGCAPKKTTPPSSEKKSACASKKETTTKSACAPKKEKTESKQSACASKKESSSKSACARKKETSSRCEKEGKGQAGDKKSVEGTKCKIPMSTGRLVNAEPSCADKKPKACGQTKANKRPESKKCMEDPCVKLLGLECENKTNKVKDGGKKCRIPMREGSMVDPGASKSKSKSGSTCSKDAPKSSPGSKVKFLAVPKNLSSNTIDTNLIDISNSTMLKDNAVRPVMPALSSDKMENPDDIIQIMEAPSEQIVNTNVISLKNVSSLPILDINPIRPVIPTLRKDYMENPDDIIQIMGPLTNQPDNKMDISLNNVSNTAVLKMSTIKPVISSLVADQMENPDDIIQIIGALKNQAKAEIGLESTPKYAVLKINSIKPEIPTLNENKIENPNNIIEIMEAPSSLQVKSTGISLKSRSDSSLLKGTSVTPTLDTNQKKNPTLNENQMENSDNIIQIMESPSSLQVKSTDISLKSRSDSSLLKGSSVTPNLDTNQKKNTTENSKGQKTAEPITQQKTEIPKIRKELLLTNAQSTSRKLDEAKKLDRIRNTEINHHKLQSKPVSTSKMQIQAKPNKTFESKSDTKVKHEFKWFKFIPRTNRHKSRTPDDVIQRPETPTYNPIKYIEKSVSMQVKDVRSSLDLAKSKTNLNTHSEIQTSTKEKVQPLCDTKPSKPIEKKENLSTSTLNPQENSVKPSLKGNTSPQGQGQSIADKKLIMPLVPKPAAPIQNMNKSIDSKKSTKTVTEEIVDKCFQFFSKKVTTGTSQNSEPSTEKKIQINNTSSVASKETSSLKKSLTHLNDKLGIENPIKVSTCDKAICRDSLLSRTPLKTNENFNQNQIKVKNENVISKSESSKDFLSIRRPAVVNPISAKTNVSINTSNNIEEKLKKYAVSTSQLVSELDSRNTKNSSSSPTKHSKNISFSSNETKLVDPVQVDPSRMKYAETVLPKPAETLPVRKPLEVADSTLPVKNEEVHTNSFLSEKENLEGSQLTAQSNQDIEGRDKETNEIEEFKRTANQILMEVDAILHTETCSKSKTDALPEHSKITSVSQQEVSESKMSTENNLSKDGHSAVLLKSEPVLSNSSLEEQTKVSSIKLSPLDTKHNEMKFVSPKANEKKVDKLNFHAKTKSASLNRITPKASTSSIVRSVVSKYNQMKASLTKLPISKSTSKLSSKTNIQLKDIKSSTKTRNDKKIELPIPSNKSKTASAGKIPHKVSKMSLWSHKASEHNTNKFPTKLGTKNKIMPKNPEIQNVDQRKSTEELQTKKNVKPISTDLTNSGTSNKTLYKSSKTSFIKSDESKINQTKSSTNINRGNAESHVNWEASKLALNRNIQFKNSATSFGRSEVPKPTETKTSTEVRRRKTENLNTKDVSKSAHKSDTDSKTMSASTALSIKTKEMIKAQKRLTAIEKAEKSPREPRREEDFSPYRSPTATSQLAKTAKVLHFEKQEASDRRTKVKIHVPGMSSTPEFGKSGSTKISTHIKQTATDPSSENDSKAKTLIKSMPESDINFRSSRSLFVPIKPKSLMEPKNQLTSKNQNNPIKTSYGSIDPEKKASDRLSSTTRKLNKNDGSKLTSTTKQEVKSVKIVNDPTKETESKSSVSIKELQMKSALQLAVENTAKVNETKKTKSFGPNGRWTPLPVPSHKNEQSPAQQKFTTQQKTTTDINKKNPKKIHTLTSIQENIKTAD